MSSVAQQPIQQNYVKIKAEKEVRHIQLEQSKSPKPKLPSLCAFYNSPHPPREPSREMTVAGYLVLNNVRAAYVEIHNGVLICTPRLRKNTPPSRIPAPIDALKCRTSDEHADAGRLSCSSTDSTATTMSSSDFGDEMLAREERSGALPILALRRMKRNVTIRHKTIYDESHEDDNDDDEPVPEDEPAANTGGRERVVQLSGHVVEVIDKEDEFEAPSYPFSFQVNTYTPAKRDPAGNKIGNSELVDSLILSAMDEKAKALWVKRIKHWNRFGWRETEFVNADDNDFFYLQAMMLSNEKCRRSVHAYPSSQQSRGPTSQASTTADGSTSTAAPATSGRPARRRFYRAQAGLNALAPPAKLAIPTQFAAM